MKENKENQNKLTLAMCSVTCVLLLHTEKLFYIFFYTTFCSCLFVVVMCYYKKHLLKGFSLCLESKATLS